VYRDGGRDSDWGAAGMLIVRRVELRALALGIAGIFQTIPSLALFGFLIPIPFIGGIGKRTAIVALTLYALLPILRNTYVGLTEIDPRFWNRPRRWG